MSSQSVETATMIHLEVGYDGAKQIKGRKRHIVVDTLGLLMVVAVTAASLPEREGAKLLWLFRSCYAKLTVKMPV